MSRFRPAGTGNVRRRDWRSRWLRKVGGELRSFLFRDESTRTAVLDGAAAFGVDSGFCSVRCN